MVSFFGFNISRDAPGSAPPVLSVEDLPAYLAASSAPVFDTFFDGDKFVGGFGATQIQITDYWTLRARSSQLFNENLYARGLIRRLVTNEINTGLTPEACPNEEVIGVSEGSLVDWTETAETRFGLWAKSPRACDWKQQSTFGEIQREARREALVSGDVLVVLRMSQQTKLPMVQLVSGGAVQTPLAGGTELRSGNKITHGVEQDKRGRIVAHWIRQDNLKSERIPAFGEKTGRKLSWLVYGTDKRLDEVRGQPLLALVLQSLKEIDRYRDSVQRKAVINSILAMFLKKTEDKPSSRSLSGGAARNDKATVTDGDGKVRTLNISKQVPGVIAEELQTGEEPVGFGSQGIDLNFGDFEEAIIQGVAWANEIPPEILRLTFSNNYSASQAAINEFRIYINMVWSTWGETFCSPIYAEFVVAETMLGKIATPGLLEARRSAAMYDILAAWLLVDWYGSIKPSTDMLKATKGAAMLVERGWSTNAKVSRELTGTKFSSNLKRLGRENELLVEAVRPRLEFEAALKTPSGTGP